MGTLNYIAYVIFAVLFVSIAIAIYAQYQQGAAEQDFKVKAEELAGNIEQLGNMSTGSVQNFEISVPRNCELRFTDNTVFILIGSWSDNFPVGIPVSGPIFSDQKLSLRLERTENGVNVSAT
jgi:hypothetical protein